MTRKNPPAQPSFSRRFDAAMVTTRVTDALARSDGWRLDQLAAAPAWLKEMYGRHADAACRELHAIQEAENNFKPSRHQ